MLKLSNMEALDYESIKPATAEDAAIMAAEIDKGKELDIDVHAGRVYYNGYYIADVVSREEEARWG